MTSPLITSMSKRQLVATMINCIEQDLLDKGIHPRNALVGRAGNYRLNPSHKEEIEKIFNEVIEMDIQVENQEMFSLIRAVLDDTRHAVSDEQYSVAQICDVLLPRHRDIQSGPPEKNFIEPFDKDVILTTCQATEYFLNENDEYIRRRFQAVCQRDNPSIPEAPTQEELEDLEKAEGLWVVLQNSNEGLLLSAALNYTQKELLQTEDRRFAYIAKVLPAIQEISKTTPSRNSNNPVMRFVLGAANVLHRYLGSPSPVEEEVVHNRSAIEADVIDLFNSCHYFRHSLGHHREMSLSVLRRITNGKPAYTDLANLVTRYRGLHLWGFENLVRRFIPILRVLYNSPNTQKEVVDWLDQLGILIKYQENKKFYFRVD